MMKKISALLLIAACAWGCSKDQGDKPGTANTTGEGTTPEQPKASATIAISCGAVGQELELCKKAAEEWATKTGNKVNVISTPNSATERLALYQQILGAGASDIDVFQIDVIWPGILGNHFIDLKAHSKGVEASHFEAIIENNTVAGKLVAMPWFTDARPALLPQGSAGEVQRPAADDLDRADRDRQEDPGRRARRRQRQDVGLRLAGQGLRGPDLQRARVGDELRRRHHRRADGKITINNPQAIAALQTAAGWIGTITPDGVLNYSEEEARGVFQTGNAVFMRNWPYAWASRSADDSPIKDKVGVAALPKGGAEVAMLRHAGRLAARGLQVLASTPRSPPTSSCYLTSTEVQKQRAIQGSYNPTIADAVQGPGRADRNALLRPAVRHLRQRRAAALHGHRARSTTRSSNEFWNAVHATLSGKTPADKSLQELQSKLDDMSRGGTNW